MTTATELPAATKLAIDRTRLAHDRTLMAWVRTSTSLISFGFTIYKFFQALRESQPVAESRLFGPREFALMMIGMGVGALMLATLQHRTDLQALRAEYGQGPVPKSLTTLLAIFISVFGVIGFVSVWFRL
jgi:putative membrane protein